MSNQYRADGRSTTTVTAGDHRLTSVGQTEVWTEFRDDHELLERLRVTPDELAALDKCVLLGTLTCKQDLLFILRQIREVSETSADEIKPGDDAVRVRKPRPVDAEGLRHGREPLSGAALPDKAPSSAIAGTLRRQGSETILLLISAIISGAGLLWALLVGLNALSRRAFATIGAGRPHTPPDPGLKSLFTGWGLFGAEIVFVAMFVVVYSFDRWKTMRRHKSYRQMAASRR